MYERCMKTKYWLKLSLSISLLNIQYDKVQFKDSTKAFTEVIRRV